MGAQGVLLCARSKEAPLANQVSQHKLPCEPNFRVLTLPTIGWRSAAAGVLCCSLCHGGKGAGDRRPLQAQAGCCIAELSSSASKTCGCMYANCIKSPSAKMLTEVPGTSHFQNILCIVQFTSASGQIILRCPGTGHLYHAWLSWGLQVQDTGHATQCELRSPCPVCSGLATLLGHRTCHQLGVSSSLTQSHCSSAYVCRVPWPRCRSWCSSWT